MANKLEDGSFTRWCHAAAVWYGEDRVQAEALRPSEFSLHDVEYASDVASLIPVLYTFARYQQGVGRYHPSRSPVIIRKMGPARELAPRRFRWSRLWQN